jgi:hypothetical protein
MPGDLLVLKALGLVCLAWPLFALQLTDSPDPSGIFGEFFPSPVASPVLDDGTVYFISAAQFDAGDSNAVTDVYRHTNGSLEPFSISGHAPQDGAFGNARAVAISADSVLVRRAVDELGEVRNYRWSLTGELLGTAPEMPDVPRTAGRFEAEEENGRIIRVDHLLETRSDLGLGAAPAISPSGRYITFVRDGQVHRHDAGETFANQPPIANSARFVTQLNTPITITPKLGDPDGPTPALRWTDTPDFRFDTPGVFEWTFVADDGSHTSTAAVVQLIVIDPTLGTWFGLVADIAPAGTPGRVDLASNSVSYSDGTTVFRYHIPSFANSAIGPGTDAAISKDATVFRSTATDDDFFADIYRDGHLISASDSANASSPDISADGQRIVYELDGDIHLWAPGERRVLGAGHSPRISADGFHVVWIHENDLMLDGQVIANSAANPSISASGKVVAWESLGETRQVRTQSLLVSTVESAFSPAISANGRFLYYRTRIDGVMTGFVRDLRNPQTWTIGPAWKGALSEDGSLLAYVSGERELRIWARPPVANSAPNGIDSDPDGDDLLLTLLEPPEHGRMIDGVYQPFPDFEGEETLRYRVSDGQASITATVTHTVVASPGFRITGPVVLARGVVSAPVDVIDFRGGLTEISYVDVPAFGTIIDQIYRPQDPDSFGHEQLRVTGAGRTQTLHIISGAELRDLELQSGWNLFTLDITPALPLDEPVLSVERQRVERLQAYESYWIFSPRDRIIRDIAGAPAIAPPLPIADATWRWTGRHFRLVEEPVVGQAYIHVAQ